MIKKIEGINEIAEFGKTDLYSVRIMSLINAYGTGYDFATFYKQINNEGKITAIISKLDGDITVSDCDNDFYELARFIDTIGYSTCLCSGITDYNRPYDEGVIMSTRKKAEIIMPYVEIDEFPKLMDIYNYDDYDNADFEAWYVDASHRIRHNCAKAYSLNINGEIVSSGIFSSIYNNDAVLTAVHTVPEFRLMGYGSALVSHMICDIKGTVYLMRESGKNEQFYKKLGFENTGKWRMYK